MKYSDAMNIVEDFRWKNKMTEEEEERYRFAIDAPPTFKERNGYEQ